MDNTSITSAENRDWLQGRGWLQLQRYIRRNHDKKNHRDVFGLIFEAYPDEGRKLVENHDTLDVF